MALPIGVVQFVRRIQSQGPFKEPASLTTHPKTASVLLLQPDAIRTRVHAGHIKTSAVVLIPYRISILTSLSKISLIRLSLQKKVHF